MHFLWLSSTSPTWVPLCRLSSSVRFSKPTLPHSFVWNLLHFILYPDLKLTSRDRLIFWGRSDGAFEACKEFRADRWTSASGKRTLSCNRRAACVGIVDIARRWQNFFVPVQEKAELWLENWLKKTSTVQRDDGEGKVLVWRTSTERLSQMWQKNMRIVWCKYLKCRYWSAKFS